MIKGEPGIVAGLSAEVLDLDVLLAACSGEAPTPTQTTVPAETSTPTQTNSASQPTATPTTAISKGGPVREIEVTLKDNTFPEVTDFTAGETVRLIITNNGSIEHTHEITDFKTLWHISARTTKTFEWTVPNEPGEHDCGCYLTEPSDDEHVDILGNYTILQAAT